MVFASRAIRPFLRHLNICFHLGKNASEGKLKGPLLAKDARNGAPGFVMLLRYSGVTVSVA
jgi:hypothetical protein